MPRYQNICAVMRGFNIFKKTAWKRTNVYPGMVVAGADAFYYAIDQKLIIGPGAVLGAVGGLVEGMRGKKKRKQYMPQEVEFVEETDLADLPEDITGDPDWPVTWDEGPVIVVPRRAVVGVRTGFWIGGIDVEVEDMILRTFTPIFKRKKMVAYLLELGWTGLGLD